MAVWRIDAHMELDPATPGMASFDSKLNGRLAESITIALTNENSFVDNILETSGPPSGQRILLRFRLVFTDRIPFDDILSDVFDVVSTGPNVYGDFLFPQAVLAVDPADPEPQRSRLIAHECTHDGPFSPCSDNIIASYKEA